MAESLGHKATSGVVWASVDRFANMGLQFVINLIMARLLLPSDFGAIGMLTIFLAVSATLVDGGFNSALIQKKESSQTDFSTIFFWGIGLAAVIYLFLFIAAPWIGDFFNMPILKNVLRVIGLIVIGNSITSIQSTRLRKLLEFKKLAIVNISSYFLSGALGIWMAYNGFGVWSLVAQQLSSSAITIVMLLTVTRWLPSLEFSKKSFRELFSFGGYILAANVLQEICKNFQGIIIGRRFSATQMGYFSQAHKLDLVTSYSLPQTIVTVMYPVYSTLQDERERLISILAMNIRVIAYVIFPMLALLILLAEPIITGLYGAKWYAAIPYYQILCVGGMFVCLQNVNFYAIAACGKSKALFRWSFYKWSFLLAALFIGSIFGMKGLLWGMVLSNLNIYVVNASLSQRYVGYPLLSQLGSLFPIAAVVAVAYTTATIAMQIPLIGYPGALITFIAVYGLLSIRLRGAGEFISMLARLIKR